MDGVVGFRFQFQAKLPDMIVNGSSRRIILITPNFVQELRARNHPAGILDEEFEKLEFMCRHRYRLAIPRDFHFCEINGYIPECEHVANLGPGCAAQRSL